MTSLHCKIQEKTDNLFLIEAIGEHLAPKSVGIERGHMPSHFPGIFSLLLNYVFFLIFF